jgi:hypothetical protein
MDKTQIASIVGLISLVVGAIYHVEVKQDIQLQLVELIWGAVSVLPLVWNAIKNRNKNNPS